jgi:hypothetical protein
MEIVLSCAIFFGEIIELIFIKLDMKGFGVLYNEILLVKYRLNIRPFYVKLR